ncbi:hypothetical protein EXVG_00288 [Emiliania huxleyi virus 202]|nr:hypothetical protein EXVG_00288 [Emiliania huxleyi virus 202]AHA54091.1 putative membrane protein [Emiliania huxleyi virus 18]AHA55140.1 putative membrane protein [Emiliania huxleyi virus 156]
MSTQTYAQVNSTFEQRSSEMRSEANNTLKWMGIGFGIFVVVLCVLGYISYKKGKKHYNKWQDEAAEKEKELTKPFRDVINDPNASPKEKMEAHKYLADLQLRFYNARARNMHHFNNHHSRSSVHSIHT